MTACRWRRHKAERCTKRNRNKKFLPRRSTRSPPRRCGSAAAARRTCGAWGQHRTESRGDEDVLDGTLTSSYMCILGVYAGYIYVRYMLGICTLDICTCRVFVCWVYKFLGLRLV